MDGITIYRVGHPPSQTAEDKRISASIARLDKMLQPRETSDDGSSLGDGQESGGTGLDAEALKVLDGQKLPVNDRVSDWLNGSPAPNQSGVFSTVFADKEVNLLEHLGRMQLLHNLLHPVTAFSCEIQPCR